MYTVEKLHAKLFMNESSVILASMNLHEASSKNSKEVALSVTGEGTKSELLAYVERLMRLGHEIYPRPATTKARPTAQYKKETHPEVACHRCGRKWGTTPAKPLCPPCYQEVSQ